MPETLFQFQVCPTPPPPPSNVSQGHVLQEARLDFPAYLLPYSPQFPVTGTHTGQARIQNGSQRDCLRHAAALPGNTLQRLQEGLWARPAQDSKLIRGCLGSSSSMTHRLGFCDQARSRGCHEVPSLNQKAMVSTEAPLTHRSQAASQAHLSSPWAPKSTLSGRMKSPRRSF